MIFLTLSFLLYFAPALLATSRRAPNAVAIWLTNFFVGWTIIGWVITLIWALNSPPLAYVAVQPVVVGGAGYPPVAPAYPQTGADATVTGNVPYTSAAAGDGAVPAWRAVASEAGTRTCVGCGRPVPADARFCPACGSVESRLG